MEGILGWGETWTGGVGALGMDNARGGEGQVLKRGIHEHEREPMDCRRAAVASVQPEYENGLIISSQKA